jgi:ectoine hydroxylase-related dioxygenase (phytanoyl-CoA dioxygenase family)
MPATVTKETLLSQLATPYALPAGAVEFYQEYGYVKLKDVLSSEVIEYYGQLITSEVIRLNTLTKPMEERTTYEKAFLQIMNLWREHEEVKEFVFSERLAKIATDLMQVGGVRLYHDQALYKEPSGGITPWHADQFYWPLATEKTVTVWIPLQATPMEMGPLAFAEKSQSVEIGRNLEISDESEAYMATQLAQFTLNETPFELGEVSFHAGWLFHRAGANHSASARKVMTIIYMDKDQTITTPQNTFQEADWRTWLGCKEISTIPDSPLNPVLFSY